VVSFAGDVQKLPFEDRLFFDQFRLFTGQQLPYAALMYVWGSRTPRDGIVPNGLTSRIKIIAVESGRGSWVRGWRRRATSRRTSGAPSAKSLAESSAAEFGFCGPETSVNAVGIIILFQSSIYKCIFAIQAF
jgi:hypothetical protein